MNIKIEGMDKLGQILKDMPKKVNEAAETELKRITLDLQNKAQNLTPVNKDPDAKTKGNLKRSADSDAQIIGDKVEGYVSFDTPYATRQHEEMDYKHEQGQAKYLEQPFKENIDKYTSALGNAIAKAVNKP